MSKYYSAEVTVLTERLHFPLFSLAAYNISTVSITHLPNVHQRDSSPKTTKAVFTFDFSFEKEKLTMALYFFKHFKHQRYRLHWQHIIIFELQTESVVAKTNRISKNYNANFSLEMQSNVFESEK